MHKVRIEFTGPNRGRVWVGGVEVTHITAVSFSASVDSVAEVKLTILADEVMIDGEQVDVTCLNDAARTFKAVA